MDEYKLHNLFRRGLAGFLTGDPQLCALEELRFVHPMDWWRDIKWKEPGIYILTGGRQIGKTTSTKLLIKNVLEEKIFDARNVFYLPCDQVMDHIQLSGIIRQIFEEIAAGDEHFLLILDEITFVKEWDRSVKALADEGWFRKGFCIITGSDAIVLREAAGRFPGRMGTADKNEFHLYPLGFKEFVDLTASGLCAGDSEGIFARFDDYMKCGGHLRAINDLYMKGEVSKATYLVFEQWICGDFEKRGKSKNRLMGIFKQFFETSGTQMSFSSLANRMGELTKDTFIDYYDLLERMGVMFSLQALDMNKRIGSPKKARRFHFWDPFIFDAVRRWLERDFAVSIGGESSACKAESIVAAHFKKAFPSYYFKAKGEIDVVAVDHKTVRPMEVKWTTQLRPWDMRELKKFPDSVILTKFQSDGIIDGVPTRPLPIFLLEH